MHDPIQQREVEGIVVLDLKGHVTLGPEDLALREHLQTLLDTGRKNMIVNLHSTAGMDASVLESLLYFAALFQLAGGRLVMVDPSHRASDLEVDAAIDTFSDEQAAINSFFPDRAVPHYDILHFVEEEEQRRSGSNGEKNNA